MSHRDFLVSDLSNLEAWKFSISQMVSEIQTIDSEIKYIKATNYDKLPSSTGVNSQQSQLDNALAKKFEREAELDWTRRKVEDMERLLGQLSPDERNVIERMCIQKRWDSASQLAEELHIDPRQVYNRKQAALHHLSILRYGAGYRP